MINDVRILGIPRKIHSEDHYNALVAAYVDGCIEEEIPLTLNGLMLWMGFIEPQDFYSCPKYGHLAKRAKRIVEQSLEQKVADSKVNAKGAQFLLKTMHAHSEKIVTENHDRVTINIEGDDTQL